MSDTSSSFYTDGESYTTGVASPPTDNPGSGSVSQAPTSFYNDGPTYAPVTTVEATLDEVNAAVAQTQANAAAADTSATNAATSASAAATSASAAAASDTDATAQAANAATNAGAAYTNAQSAQTSATNAATSATAASGSASSASTSATNASNSATAAAGSATAAGTSATNAASSASAAAASASSALWSSNGATVTPSMDGTAAVGTDAHWAHGDHVHPTDTSRAALTQVVRVDTAQSLTAAQQQQARQNEYVPPFDAMRDNNIVINGAMEVSQLYSTTAQTLVSGVNTYITDQWWASFAHSGGGFASGQIAISSLPCFPYCMDLANTANFSSYAAGDYVEIAQPIEGYRMAHLGWGTTNAQPLTLGFWINCNTGGTFSVGIRNATGTRSYVANVTVVSATWTWVTVTIPGDTAGTWPNTNGVCAYLAFCFGSGTTAQAPAANTWQGANYFATASTSTTFWSASNAIYITGVVAIAGNEAPSAARSQLMLRRFEEEERLCFRYLQVFNSLVMQSSGVGNNIFPVPFKQRMRVTPTAVGLAAPTYVNGASAATVQSINTDQMNLQFNSANANAYLSNWQFYLDSRM